MPPPASLDRLDPIRLILVTLVAVPLIHSATGCASSPLTMEADAEQVATIIGVPETELVFVSGGDVAVAKEFTDFFEHSDAAVIALTDDALYWLHLNSSPEEQAHRIPAKDIVTLARDVGCFQVKTDDELYLVRLRGWQRHTGDGARMLDFMTHLFKANGSLFLTDAEIVYQKPFNPYPRQAEPWTDSDSVADAVYEPPPSANPYPQAPDGRHIR